MLIIIYILSAYLYKQPNFSTSILGITQFIFPTMSFFFFVKQPIKFFLIMLLLSQSRTFHLKGSNPKFYLRKSSTISTNNLLINND